MRAIPNAAYTAKTATGTSPGVGDPAAAAIAAETGVTHMIDWILTSKDNKLASNWPLLIVNFGGVLQVTYDRHDVRPGRMIVFDPPLRGAPGEAVSVSATHVGAKCKVSIGYH